MVREIATKTSYQAGDGTTTAVVLAHAIAREGATKVKFVHSCFRCLSGPCYHALGSVFRMISNPPPGNWLLKTLSAEDQALVTPHLERVSVKRGDLLEVAGEAFPGLFSL
jgi:hypothetical protein